MVSNLIKDKDERQVSMEIIAAVIVVVGTIVAAVVGANLARQTRCLRYRIASREVAHVVGHQTSRVRLVAMTPDARANGGPEPVLLDETGIAFTDVRSAHEALIAVRNAGDSAIAEQELRFHFAENSRVVSVEPSTRDARFADRIVHSIVASNTARVRLSFLNPREEIIVRVLIVNGDPSDCEVVAPGLSCRPDGPLRLARAASLLSKVLRGS